MVYQQERRSQKFSWSGRALQKRQMGKSPKNIWGENYNHRINCSAANFLAALMWRKPMNKARLAVPTHKEARGGVRWDKYPSKSLDGQQVEGQDHLKGTI